ncbi:hypothetical protein Tco_1137854, partial [Tanacetum coccineum]
APEEDGSGEDGSASIDPYLAVNGSETSYVVLWELMEYVKTAIDAKLSRVVKMRKHIEDDHERKKLELAEEHKRNKAELEDTLIMEYLVKISKKARILELKRRHLKITVLTSNTPYPSRKIRRICACTSLKTTKEQDPIRRI